MIIKYFSQKIHFLVIVLFFIQSPRLSGNVLHIMSIRQTCSDFAFSISLFTLISPLGLNRSFYYIISLLIICVAVVAVVPVLSGGELTGGGYSGYVVFITVILHRNRFCASCAREQDHSRTVTLLGFLSWLCPFLVFFKISVLWFSFLWDW